MTVDFPLSVLREKPTSSKRGTMRTPRNPKRTRPQTYGHCPTNELAPVISAPGYPSWLSSGIICFLGICRSCNHSTTGRWWTTMTVSQSNTNCNLQPLNHWDDGAERVQGRAEWNGKSTLKRFCSTKIKQISCISKCFGSYNCNFGCNCTRFCSWSRAQKNVIRLNAIIFKTLLNVKLEEETYNPALAYGPWATIAKEFHSPTWQESP